MASALPGGRRSVAAARPLLASPEGAAGAAAPGVRDELSAQNLAQPPRFVVVTTAGVLELEKLRPADVLAQVIWGALHFRLLASRCSLILYLVCVR